jgi:LAO/AO transport system kinase
MKRVLPKAETYAEGILKGDRVMLGRAITLVESTHPEHQMLAQEVLERCLPHTGNSVRIGITGSPGVGKSTFIESFGSWLIAGCGRKIAVLAIDPTSHISKGSILGDKTRMSRLAMNADAFIRPSPARGSLGGVASHTREAMLLCEAAGFDTLIVETVGVGQSEVSVHSMVDFFLLLLLPGAGDELQGIKRGIVEMADLIAINKADGERVEAANLARREYSRALHLFQPKASGWMPQVITCSAMSGDGIGAAWEQVSNFESLTRQNGWREFHRHQQLKNWFSDLLEQGTGQLFRHHPAIRENLPRIEKKVMEGKISPTRGAAELFRLFTS